MEASTAMSPPHGPPHEEDTPPWVELARPLHQAEVIRHVPEVGEVPVGAAFCSGFSPRRVPHTSRRKSKAKLPPTLDAGREGVLGRRVRGVAPRHHPRVVRHHPRVHHQPRRPRRLRDLRGHGRVCPRGEEALRRGAELHGCGGCGDGVGRAGGGGGACGWPGPGERSVGARGVDAGRVAQGSRRRPPLPTPRCRGRRSSSYPGSRANPRAGGARGDAPNARSGRDGAAAPPLGWCPPHHVLPWSYWQGGG
mmetsp:Transcript_38181/g.120565  ORF Transcript_38181/g.120565 Transcript_38181/m.120565 type:complete len:251 (+) Transcript_38181:1104-1856(+)